MNLTNDEIVRVIIGLYYYQQELDCQEQSDTLQISSLREIVDLRDKLEDYLLTTQPPEYAKETGEFIKTLAEVMEEKKINKRMEAML
tara:strand:- start:797 stop:1057 length:261 start_codon:yes stop_codon:yes gene_type:complete